MGEGIIDRVRGLITGNKVDYVYPRTKQVIDRVRRLQGYAPPNPESRYGSFWGRHIIAEDVPINKGVFLGLTDREAIIVDDEKDPSLRKIYDELTANIKQNITADNPNSTKILEQVFNITEHYLRPTAEKGNPLIANATGNKLVLLGDFINQGMGVCRHQSLLSGYLTETLIKEGVLPGSVSIDRAFIPGQSSHSWMRYTDNQGKVVVIDSTLGILWDIRNMSPDQKPNYKRPTDH